MNATPIMPRRAAFLALIALLLLAACRPEEDFHITPSPTPTPEPTATPSPTPPPADYIDPHQVNLDIMARLIELLPNPLSAGEEQWKRNYEVGDDGVESILGVRRPAVGREIYFFTQQGSKMSLNFVIFSDADGARAEFERKQELRSSLVNLAEDDSLPKPNLTGGGLYGSFGLFQIDNYFIEVFIEIFTTSSSPLKPLSRAALRFLMTSAKNLKRRRPLTRRRALEETSCRSSSTICRARSSPIHNGGAITPALMAWKHRPMCKMETPSASSIATRPPTSSI